MTAVQTSVQTDTISDFLDALAAKIPAPGGGAVAGLHLAQGAAQAIEDAGALGRREYVAEGGECRAGATLMLIRRPSAAAPR